MKTKVMQKYYYNTTTLKYEPLKDKGKYVNWIVIAIVCLFLGFSSAVKVNTVIERIPVILKDDVDTCTKENIKAYIKKLNLRFPEIVYQQVMLESGELQAPIFLELNNLLGMEVARIRPTVSTDAGVRFARYDNWQQSLIDYALWQASYAQGIKTSEAYYQLLDQMYCNNNLLENKGELYSVQLKRISYGDARTSK